MCLRSEKEDECFIHVIARYPALTTMKVGQSDNVCNISVRQ